MKGYAVFDLSLNYLEHEIFVPHKFSRISGHKWTVSQNNFEHSNHLILKECRSPNFGSPSEDPFHSPLISCRQRSNMETDPSLSILRAYPTISNKHFLLKCHMKGHIHFRMGELRQPVDTLGIKVMFSMGLKKYSFNEIFKVIFHSSKEPPFFESQKRKKKPCLLCKLCFAGDNTVTWHLSFLDNLLMLIDGVVIRFNFLF